MKLFLQILLGVVIIIVLTAGIGIFYMTRGLETGKTIKIGKVDPAALEDGTYRGSYKNGRWSNNVEVTVKDGKINGIMVVKDVKFPQPDLSKNLINEIIKQQNIDVDIVSGATVTSKAYLKAVEDALQNSGK